MAQDDITYDNYDELVGVDTTVIGGGDGDAINLFYDGNDGYNFSEPQYTALLINNDIVFSMRKKVWTGFEYKLGENLEALKITPDGFYCLGKQVDDINNVYEKFSKWINNTIQ